MRRSIFCILISLFSLVWLSSCADSAPSISAVSAQLVFDYQTDTEIPAVSLSVFVQPVSQPSRVDSITLINQTENLEWYVNNPLIIGSGSPAVIDSGLWVGSGFIMPAHGGRLPGGTYDIVYTDLADQTAVAQFSLSIPEELYDLKWQEAKAAYYEKSDVSLLVYAEDGTLVYSGKQRPEWRSYEDIQAVYKNAAYVRLCLSVHDSDAVCILPAGREIT